MTSAQVINASVVPGTKSVFLLGCFETRVTLLAQQVRAINLVDALLEQNLVRETGKVAIVGAGVAGMTAAAALAIAAPKLKAIDVYESKEEVLHLQRDSQDRYVHPHIYDWPLQGSERADAGLPVLDWQAGSAGEVATVLEKRFDAIRRHSGIINLKLGLGVERLTPAPQGPGCRLFVKDSPKEASGFYDAVILAIGFGYESYLSESNHSYWSASTLSGPIRAAGNDHAILVSGNGDGGLVDFMMAAYNHLSHRRIFDFVTQYPGLEPAKRLLLTIDEQAWAAGQSVDIYERYKSDVLGALPEHMLLDVADQLRRDVRILFHTRKRDLFRRDTAIINRFCSLLAIAADERSGSNRIRVVVGRDFVAGPPLTGEVQIDGQVTFTPFLRFLRLGAERQQNLEPFRALADAFQAGAVPTMPGFRPATPELMASAKSRFAMLLDDVATPLPLATQPLPPEATTQTHLSVRLQRQANGQFSWSGDVTADDVARVWSDDVITLEVTCNAAPSLAGPLVSALARLCGHAARCEFRCSDRRRWEEAMQCFAGPALPGASVDWRFSIVGGAGATDISDNNTTFSAKALAEQIHSALDDRVLTELHDDLFSCLREDSPSGVGWIIEGGLRRLMWSKWEAWHSALHADPVKLRRFLVLLTTERDDLTLSYNALVNVGRKTMRSHLVRAVVFALAFASCSDDEFAPSGAYPGNIDAPSIKGHATGISWINGRDIGPDVSRLRWTAGLVLLSELKASLDFLKRQEPRLDRFPGDLTRIPDTGLAEQPIIFGCDYEFQSAMETGADAVRAYIATALRDRAATANVLEA